MTRASLTADHYRLETDLGHTHVITYVYGRLTPLRLAAERAAHIHRVEQLVPQPKIEFERDEEDMPDGD